MPLGDAYCAVPGMLKGAPLRALTVRGEGRGGGGGGRSPLRVRTPLT